jgi:hypothetical protein
MRTLQDLAREESAGKVTEDLRVEFLAAEPGPFISLLDLLEELRGEVLLVLERAAARDHDIDAFARDQLFQQGDRPRRRGDEPARLTAEPETKHCLVPDRLRVLERTQLI